MKYSILTSILFCLFVCCSKDYKKAKDDGAADGYIRGRLFVIDTLTTYKYFVPLAGKTLTISYNESTDELNSLFTTQTDKDGYFVFNQLKKERIYRIKYEEKSDSDRIYTGIRPDIKANFDTLTVIAWLNLSEIENGLHYTVTDTDGNPVKGATVCIYNNKVYFQQGKCENSAYSLVTDAYGHAFKFNIPHNTYYTAAYITANGNSYSFRHDENVAGKKIFIRKPLEKAKPTEFTYTVKDENDNLLANATLCFFTSEIASNTGDCDLANLGNKKSNAEGKVKVTELPAGWYYVIGKWQSGSVTLSGKDFIEIRTGESIPDEIILK